jgi:hypothetical protein
MAAYSLDPLLTTPPARADRVDRSDLRSATRNRATLLREEGENTRAVRVAEK